MNPLPRIIGFPSVYIQGPGAIRQLRPELERLCQVKSAALVVSPAVAGIFDTGAGLAPRLLPLEFAGECTQREVDRLVRAAAPDRPGAVVGAGGGKALDTAKAVAHALDVPMISVPTVASSDAPTSRLIALYDDWHRLVATPGLRRNPDAVIVDTEVIARAPRRFFVAGIGDAISKRFEVAQARDAGITNFVGGLATELSLLLAEHTYATLRNDALKALEALERGQPDAAFERVVEATVLYSGLAFEGGGLSIAHGLLRGLTAFRETLACLHGELVAYGLLVQLQTFGHESREISELRNFLRTLGLPVKLSQLGFSEASPAIAGRIAELTMTAPYVAQSRSAVGAKDILEAMLALESLE
jgi:glycerol dehydrogenase